MLTGHNELMSNCHTGKQKVESLELASSSFGPHVVAFCVKPLPQISYPLKKEKGICTLHLNSTQRCNIQVIIILYFSSKPKKQALGLFHHNSFALFNTLQDDWTTKDIKKSNLLVLALSSLAS